MRASGRDPHPDSWGQFSTTPFCARSPWGVKAATLGPGVCVRPLSKAAVYADLASTSALSLLLTYQVRIASRFSLSDTKDEPASGVSAAQEVPANAPHPLVLLSGGPRGWAAVSCRVSQFGSLPLLWLLLLISSSGPTQASWSSAHYHVLQSKISKRSPRTCCLTLWTVQGASVSKPKTELMFPNFVHPTSLSLGSLSAVKRTSSEIFQLLRKLGVDIQGVAISSLSKL